MPRPFYTFHKTYDSIIRVDHAGEFGAKYIYEGQINNTKDTNDKKVIQEMLDHELDHLYFFENELRKGVRPTIFLPLWRILGYTLGAFSAKTSNQTAMLVTASVETVIESHYEEQINYLKKTQQDNILLRKLKKFRLEEIDHKLIANDYIVSNTPLNNLIAFVTKKMCKIAILISKEF